MARRQRVIKLYATASADTDAAVYCVIPNNGIVTGVAWHALATSAAATSSAKWELSFTPARQTTVNDATGPFSMCNIGHIFATSGLAQATENVQELGLALPVVAGDRLFLNVEVTGTITSEVNVFVYIAE